MGACDCVYMCMYVWMCECARVCECMCVRGCVLTHHGNLIHEDNLLPAKAKGPNHAFVGRLKQRISFVCAVVYALSYIAKLFQGSAAVSGRQALRMSYVVHVTAP